MQTYLLHSVRFAATGSFTAFLEPLFDKPRSDIVEVLLGLMVLLGIYLIFYLIPTIKKQAFCLALLLLFYRLYFPYLIND